MEAINCLSRAFQLPFVVAAFWVMLAVSSPAEEQRPRLALLMGVGEYPQLSEAEQLEGSVNDVLCAK